MFEIINTKKNAIHPSKDLRFTGEVSEFSTKSIDSQGRFPFRQSKRAAGQPSHGKTITTSNIKRKWWYNHFRSIKNYGDASDIDTWHRIHNIRYQCTTLYYAWRANSSTLSYCRSKICFNYCYLWKIQSNRILLHFKDFELVSLKLKRWNTKVKTDTVKTEDYIHLFGIWIVLLWEDPLQCFATYGSIPLLQSSPNIFRSDLCNVFVKLHIGHITYSSLVNINHTKVIF